MNRTDREAVVIGSGAAGSATAWALAKRGWDVTVLERGRNLRPGLGKTASRNLRTKYGSDEVKGMRGFGFPDPLLEPYTTRTQAEAAQGVARSATGALGQLGAAVGGTTLHYNAKTPRFWKQDFSMLSDYGPVDGAQMADWPITYDDLEPFYDLVERRIGVQGDRSAMPRRTLQQSPRKRDFVMGPNPTGYAASRLAAGAEAIGWEPFPYPAAVNSRRRQGRRACNSCGFCSGFGCPINARGDALVSFLNPAMQTGRVRVIDRAWVEKIITTGDGRRARAVQWRDFKGRKRRISVSTVFLAGSPINTARLLLLSANNKRRVHRNGLGNRSGQVGRNMMFHNFTLMGAAFAENVHPLRAQSTTLQIDDLMGPFTGPEVQALGVPYIVGGLVQLGSGAPPVTGASTLAGFAGYGTAMKQAMRVGLHAGIAGSQLVHQDLPQAANRVDLDPKVRDFQGRPAARITYSPHRHEQAAAGYLGAAMQAAHQAAPGVVATVPIPFPLINQGITYTAHLAGTARMGDDPRTSVVDTAGRMHELDNVYITDGSTFPTFPGFNPTLTIMANAIRIARGI